MGVNFDKLGHYQKSLEHHLKSLQIEEELNNEMGMAQSQLNIGLIYIYLKQSENGIYYTRQALEYFAKINDANNQALCNGNLGIVYVDLHQYEDACRYFFKADSLFQITNNRYERIINLSNFISCKLKLGRIDEAHRDIDLSHQLNKDINIEHLNQLINIAQVEYLLAQKKYEPAAHLLQQIKATNKRIKLRTTLLEIEIELMTQPQPQISDVIDEYVFLRDSLENVFSNELVNELHIKYETDLKINQIKQQQQEISNQKKTIVLLLLSVIIFITLSLIIYLFYKRLQNTYKVLYQKTEDDALQLKSWISMKESTPSKLENRETNYEIWECLGTKISQLKLFVNPKLSLDDLALQCKSNRNYISKAINQYAQTNFNNYINKFRVEEAKTLIKNNKNYSFNTIAEMSGFNSESSFYRIFKDETGLTPKKFKELAFGNIQSK